MFKQAVTCQHPCIWHQTAVPPAGWLPPQHGLHASRQNSAPERWYPGWHSLACLNIFKCYGLPEIPPTDWSIETSTCQRCQKQAYIGHGTARIGFWPPIQPFSCRDIDTYWGLIDCSLSITGDIQHPHAMSLRHSAV
jgi:hypothetical protein